MKEIKYFTSAMSIEMFATRVRNFLMDEDNNETIKVEALIDMMDEIGEGCKAIDKPSARESIALLARNIVELNHPDSRWDKDQRCQMESLALDIWGTIKASYGPENMLDINPDAEPIAFDNEKDFYWDLLKNTSLPLEDLLLSPIDRRVLENAVDVIDLFKRNLTKAEKLT